MEFDSNVSPMGWPLWIQQTIDREALRYRDEGQRREAAELFTLSLEMWSYGLYAECLRYSNFVYVLRVALVELESMLGTISRLLEYVANMEPKE